MFRLLRTMAVGLISILCFVAVFATSSEAMEGKAGEVIRTEADIKELEAKGLLTHGQVLVYTQIVRDFGVPIRIVGATDRSIVEARGTGSKSFWKYTQMNKGKASVGSGGELLNYGGQGLPFSDVTPDDPQAGVKAAWNFMLKHEADDFSTKWRYFLTDDRGNIKNLVGYCLRDYWSFRTDIPPLPTIFPEKHHGVWYKERIGFIAPFASKGLSQMMVKYVDPRRESDVWVYVPGLRRITRIGGGNRCDCLGGFTFNMDDGYHWSGDNAKFNWKFLEAKEHLVVSISPYAPVKAGKTYVKGAHRPLPLLERRKVWVIEQTPKDPGYCYSKRMFYQDPENWFFQLTEIYDRAGRLWKMIDLDFGTFPNPEETGGGRTQTNCSGSTIDLRLWEGGCYYQYEVHTNPGLSPGLFTLDAMRRAGR